VEKLFPTLFAIRAEVLEGLARELVGGGLLETRQAGNDFEVGQSTEERLQQRLDRQDRSVEGAGITPRLEEVRGGNVPCGIAAVSSS